MNNQAIGNKKLKKLKRRRSKKKKKHYKRKVTHHNNFSSFLFDFVLVNNAIYSRYALGL